MHDITWSFKIIGRDRRVVAYLFKVALTIANDTAVSFSQDRIDRLFMRQLIVSAHKKHTNDKLQLLELV